MRPTAPFITTLLTGLLSLFFTTDSFAQTSYLTRSGKVVSQGEDKPVPSATIAVVGRGMGTVTNNQGRFTIHLPTAFARDSLQVSCVGYQSVKLAIPITTNRAWVIRLRSATVTLDEVQVQARRKTAVDILNEAVAAIPRNYDTTSVQLTAFYREDQQFDGKPVRSSQALMAVYKSANNRPEVQDGLKMISAQKKEYDASVHQLPSIINLSNGARGSLMNDLVKHVKKSFLQKRTLNDYDLQWSTVTSDRPMYVVDIEPGHRKRNAHGWGKIYIDVETLAFVRLDLHLTPAGLDHENNHQWMVKKLASMVHKLNLKMTGYHIDLSYKPHQGKWYISTVERQIDFWLHSPSRELIDKRWNVSTCFTVTEVGPTGIPPFTEGNIGEDGNAISSIIGNRTDSTGWENDHTHRTVSADSTSLIQTIRPLSTRADSVRVRVFNRQNGFTRADTLRGKLTPLRSQYDVSFYDLALKVDIAQKAISGTNKMRFRVLAPLDKLQLDLYANMQIHQIRYAGKSLSYTREYDAVFVHFPESLPVDSEQELDIDYSGKPQVPNFSVPMMGGFLWDNDRDGNPWVQVVCQGSGASLWWPNKDHLSDEPDSMRISVTVPSELMTISNGRLRQKTALPDNWTRYDWSVSYPINNYNVTLNIGKYAHRRETYGPDSLTLDYYYMPYHGETFRWVFDGVKPMLATLEKQYGKYPFPRDGFTLMESLYPMEHQSAVSFGKLPTQPVGSLSLADTLRIMQLVWHEVSHEWWGNNVSCRDMADLWIHEAFATYSEGLYLQGAVDKDGELGYIASLPAQVVGLEPIIGVRDVNHIHYTIGDLYAKASLVVYTLRHALNNDTLWASILQGIQKRFQYQTISTKDIVTYINERTATDYTPFFEQYLTYPSIPTFQYQLTEKGQSLVVRYRWKADVPDFRLAIRVTTAQDQLTLINPTINWQTMTLPHMKVDDFEVDDTRFYVKVEEVESLSDK